MSKDNMLKKFWDYRGKRNRPVIRSTLHISITIF